MAGTLSWHTTRLPIWLLELRRGGSLCRMLHRYSLMVQFSNSLQPYPTKETHKLEAFFCFWQDGGPDNSVQDARGISMSGVIGNAYLGAMVQERGRDPFWALSVQTQ
eukprot:15364593-Ditylum_brightwellii.AAC.2